MNYLHSILFGLIGFLSFNLVIADELEVNTIEEGIDFALLEFLGEWETDEGDWISPEELEDSAFDTLAQNDTVTTNDE